MMGYLCTYGILALIIIFYFLYIEYRLDHDGDFFDFIKYFVKETF